MQTKKLLPLVLMVFLAGCGQQDTSTSDVLSDATSNTENVNSYALTDSAKSDSVVPPKSSNPSLVQDDKKMNPMNIEIDKNKNYTAVLHTTEGDIEIALNAKATPVTVNNFVTLSKKDFYDNTIFHRVIDGFMIQGGDPTGTGSGGPGYKFDDEPFQGEYTRGTVAMANAGRNTNGSQFFIMHADVPLPKNYVIFGKVTKGLEVVDKIATAKVSLSQMGENSKPVNPVKIKSVDITEK